MSPKTRLTTSKTNTMPIDQALKLASREFPTAGSVTSDYWVKKGLMSQKAMDSLKASIAKSGIRTPLQLDRVRGQDLLLDGHHRLAIAKELGIKNIPFTYAGGGLVKPSYFGAGGMAKKYAKGGIAKLPGPEPAPAQKMAGGGIAKKYAKGGMVKPSYFEHGGFAKGTDTVPAMLTPGEFVVNRDSAKAFSPLLSAMNNDGRSFASPVYPEISRDYASANVGGGVFPSSNVGESNTQVDNSVYNYSLSVNVEGTDASPDQIANVVMRKLQDFRSQRVRGQVLR